MDPASDVIGLELVSPRNGRFRNNRKVASLPLAPSRGHDGPSTPMKPNEQPYMCSVETSSPRKQGNCRSNPNKRMNSRERRKQQRRASPNKAMPELRLEEQAKYAALDCEMVGVGEQGLQSALARVVLIDWNGRILLDTFVKVPEPITDYRTFVSGITEADINSDNAITFDECRSLVTSLLHGKILVGHGLKNDLAALRIHHPWQDTRDTARYEPFQKVRFDDGVLWPRKLRDLCKEKLGREVQVAGAAHSPVEDAQAALDLYKHVQVKWEKVMQYKINKTSEILRKQRKLEETKGSPAASIEKDQQCLNIAIAA